MKLKSLRSMTALATVALFATAANALTLKEVTPTTEQPIVSIPQDPIMLVFDGTATLSDEVWNNFSLKNVEIKDASGKTVDQGLLGTAWGADWGKICIYHDNEITTPGVYTMDINAGIIVEDENQSNAAPALHIVWTIGTGSGSGTTTDFTMSHVTPENGATLEKIGKNEIFVYFPGQLMLTDEAYESNVLNCVRLKDANGNVVATSEMLWEAYMPGTDETYFNIKFNEDITADGTYTITFPAGIFAPEGETSPTNQEVVLTYTVYNPANNTGILNLKSVEPAQGEVDALGNVFVYFDKDCDWNWDLDDSAKEFAIYDKDGKVAATATFRGVMGGWGQPVYAPLYFTPIEAYGTYTLTIPAGRFTVDGDATIQNKEIVLTWTIKDPNAGGAGEDNCTYDPEFYVSNYPLNKDAKYDFSYYGSAIDMVLITWKDNAVYNPNVKPYIEDANGNRIVSMGCADFSGQTRVDFNVDETKVMKSGDYTFVIPAGFAGTSEWKASGYTEGTCNAEARVPFSYIQDPNLDDVNNDFELEVTKFGFYNGETCVVNFLDKPETCPNITGGSLKKWVFGSNKNEMSMDIYLEVLDVTNGEEWLWGAGTYRQQVTSETDVKTINGKNANNEFEIEFSNSRFTLEFLQGHQYEVRAGLYKQFDGVPESQRVCYGTYVARFTGTTKGYEYSPVQIVSISKPEGADIASAKDGQVTITFSEPVTISKNDTYTRFYGGSGLQAYEDVVSNADRTQWTIIPTASSLSGATGTCDYRFQAKDDAGRMLRSDDYYTSGEKANTYITLSYSCFLGGASISVNVPEGEVESLYAFTFTAPAASHKNIGFQGTSASGKLIDIVLKDSKGNVVATVDRKDYKATESGEYNVDCQMHLDKEITGAGEYTLCVPGAYFMTGTESSSVANKPMEFNYTIAGEVETPEEPSDFVTINFSVGGYAGLGYKTLKDKEATVAIEGSEFWRLESLSLNGADVTADVTAEGLYTIPATALVKNVTLEAEFAFAHEINFEFTTTGVESVEGCDYVVKKDGETLIIDGVSVGDQIKVFSVNGMLLADKTASDQCVSISIPNGTYIVLINDVALKVQK